MRLYPPKFACNFYRHMHMQRQQQSARIYERHQHKSCCLRINMLMVK